MADFSTLISELRKLGDQLSGQEAKDVVTGVVGGLSSFSSTIQNIITGSQDLGTRLTMLRNELGMVGDAAESFAILGAQSLITEERLEALTAKTGILGKTLAAAAGPTVRLFQNQQQLTADFNKTTGAAGKYNLALQDAIARNLLFDTTGAKTAAATQGLFNTFTDFTIGGVTPAEQALVDVAVALEAVADVSTGTTAKSFQLLRTGLNLSDKELGKSVLGLEAFSEEIGVSADAIFTDFNNAMPTLAMFGSRAEQVFKQTAAAAKATGVEMSTFQSVFDLTDTFEGSAESVGQLNALLGGPFLNSVELTMAETPVERMQMLSQAFQDAGVSVDDMSRRQMQAFMGTGLFGKDATQFVATVRGEFDLLSEATGATGKDLGDLEGKLMTTFTPEQMVSTITESTLALDGFAQKMDQVNQAAGVKMLESFRAVRSEIAEQLGPLMEQLAGTTEGIATSASDIFAGAGQQTPRETVNINLLLDGKLIDQRQIKIIGTLDQ